MQFFTKKDFSDTRYEQIETYCLDKPLLIQRLNKMLEFPYFGYGKYLDNISQVIMKNFFNEKILNINGFKVTVNNPSNENDLFTQLDKGFNFPYFGYNFDALNDLFSEFFWIRETNIIIEHTDITSLTNDTLLTYIEIILSGIKMQKLIFNDEKLDRYLFVYFYPKNIAKVQQVLF